jgi:hypothetical protein
LRGDARPYYLHFDYYEEDLLLLGGVVAQVNPDASLFFPRVGCRPGDAQLGMKRTLHTYPCY